MGRGAAAYPEVVPEPSVQSVTTAPTTLREEQAGRTRRYLAMMGIRTFCFVAAYFTEGWVRWTCVVLAVVLPYIAVVLANAVRPRGVPVEATLAGQHRRHIGAGDR